MLRVGPIVRAVSSTSVVIWVECHTPGEVILTIIPDEAASSGIITTHTRTVTVGGRFYATPQASGLEPGTWYRYAVSHPSDTPDMDEPMHCFRTLDHSASLLQLAYGSCRTLDRRPGDVLSAFGLWLKDHYAERAETWPSILLLIGDQVYADEPPRELVRTHTQLRGGARTFEDFALTYEAAWAGDEHVRMALAALPTYMIFDDHEITNNWNISPQWRAKILQSKRAEVIVDGLVGYWVYQGWGNLLERTAGKHVLLDTMMSAAERGEDALEALRTLIRAEVYGETRLHWHYEIPTQPPIFVMDARADRPAQNPAAQETMLPGRIMSAEQMVELADWLQAHPAQPALLVSSVPVLLPPLIGLAEYLMGKRWRWQRTLQGLGRRFAHIQAWLALHNSFDHWPLFSATWDELVRLTRERQQDVLVLSGDVHFSYAMEGRLTHSHRGGNQAQLYQLVCTPLHNQLLPNSRRMILAQSVVKRTTYGGLHTHTLPLRRKGQQERVPRDLLIENTIALVSLACQQDGTYTLQQELLGVRNGKLDVIGQTLLPQ